MKAMRMFGCLAAMAWLFAVAPSYAGSPILELTDVPVPSKVDGSAYTLDQVKTAIFYGCQKKGWTPKAEGSSIIASILVRGKHFAEVEIPYTASAYSIRYKSSQELDYNAKKRTIHRNYNKWIGNLSSSIQGEFAGLR